MARLPERASAFDSVAAGYDQDFTKSPIGRLQRERVHAQLAAGLGTQPLDVLELGCGTGEDALFLARAGHRVLGLDGAPAMLEAARAKARQAAVQPEPRFRLADLAGAELPTEDQRFDLVFSNFGALNCLSPRELLLLAPALSARLRPGGRVVLVVMPRVCLWEWAYFGLRLRPMSALRRLRRGPQHARLGDSSVPVWYHAPRALRRAFGDGFEERRRMPVGLTLPPSYLDRLFHGREGWLHRLARLEPGLDFPILAGLADHYLLELRRGG